MSVVKSLLLFVLAAIAEIGGAWLVWQGVREHRGTLWIGAGIVALAADTGAVKWTNTTIGGGFSNTPSVANGIVYVGTAAGTLYALNATTGSLVWKDATGSEINGAVTVAGGIVYFGTFDGAVRAVRAADGSAVWTYTTGAAISSGVASLPIGILGATRSGRSGSPAAAWMPVRVEPGATAHTRMPSAATSRARPKTRASTSSGWSRTASGRPASPRSRRRWR